MGIYERRNVDGMRVFTEETDLGPYAWPRKAERIWESDGIEVYELDVRGRTKEGSWPPPWASELMNVAFADVDRSPAPLRENELGYRYFVACQKRRGERQARAVGLLIIDPHPGYTRRYEPATNRLVDDVVRTSANAVKVEFAWVARGRRREGIARTLVEVSRKGAQNPLQWHRSFSRIGQEFAGALSGPVISLFHRDAEQLVHPQFAPPYSNK